MAEVLAVLAVISVLAAVATPGFVGMMRDRRTASDTGMFTDAFRVARARALGRGAAVRVTVLPGTSPVLSIEEHLTAGLDVASSEAVPACNAPGIWRRTEVFVPRPETTALSAISHTNDPVDDVSVCYTPRGRTMVSYETGGTVNKTYNDLIGIVRLNTERGSAEGATDTKVRTIYVLPNGLTRMVL